MSSTGYRQTLSLPGILPVAIAGTLGRLTNGIVPFSLVLVFATQHSFLASGIAAAGHMITTALLSPWRGRLIDRRGTRPLIVFACAYLLLIISTAVSAGTTWWPLGVISATLAGTVAPPISPVLRTFWSKLATTKDDLKQIHALDSIVEEVAFVIAPLLTTAALAVVPAQVTLAIGAALLIPSTVGLVALSAKHSITTESTTTNTAQQTAPAKSRPFLLLPTGQGIVLPIITLGAVGGGMAVLLPAIAQQGGNIAAAGYIFAMYSAGGAVAGLIFGRLRWKATLRTQYLAVTTCFAIGIALLIPAASAGLALPAVFIAGLGMTPMFVVGYLLVDERVQPQRLTEANAWLGSGYNLGSATGSALGGLLLTTSSTTIATIAFTATAAAGVLGAARLPRQNSTPAQQDASEVPTSA